MAKRNYIGLSSSAHEPALAIVNSEGEVVFAEGSERYLQNKRAWGSPADDLVRVGDLIDEYCAPGMESVVSTSWEESYVRRYLMLFLFPFGRYLLKKYLSKSGDAHTQFLVLRTVMGYTDFFAGNNFELLNHLIQPGVPVIRRSYEHHLCHAAAACYSSPFDEALCAAIDGEGQDVAVTYFHFKNGQLERLPIKPSKASLGLFYSNMCAVCGFSTLKGEEWKVMGMAPYGQHDEELYQLMRGILRVEKGRLVYGPDRQRCEQALFARARRPDEPPLAAADIAYVAQKVFCELTFELLEYLFQLGLSKNIVMAGGCALNSACNGKLLQETSFENSYIYFAPADDGNALGAALLAYHQDNPGQYKAKDVQSPYLGSTIQDKHIQQLETHGVLKGRRIESKAELHETVAKILTEGKIVGWVQGRAEFGPRALGNRSILADPRYANVKETVNERVKFREEFRPFAPAILHEHGPEYFEHYVETRYMERALLFKESAREKVPGVVHVDGTGRLQTVKREWNEDFYELISAFHRLTGVPVLLNTSFNVMGKPIVHSAQDAVSVYLFSGLDALILGDRLYEKRLHERGGDRA